ncbi:MAG: arsenate reductase [Gammaproteobacteria bacterium]|nr:arsenate reductase [Gammaproteobacteria bacterium]MDD2928208.1 arsenate reductase [Sideroxydans sp.]MDD5470540.1 arsenate reductase [Sideroxydans sp.]
MKLYGIPNCDTVKRARAALTARGVSYEFHDFKKHGVTEAMLSAWLKQVGWQRLLKKTGPTWGKLPQEVKDSIKDDVSALALLMQHPNIIKRPVLESNGKVLATGFNETEYKELEL